MDRVETYLNLAERQNTGRSYAAAIRHYEVEGRGLLPATQASVATYLANFAGSLSINTLRLRLAALSKWHREHGFPDPTKSDLVTQVLKGIRNAHNLPEKQARPFELEHLQQVSNWLEHSESRSVDPRQLRAEYLRRHRDQAMLLLGFWRAFRSDELTLLTIENITVEPGRGMVCYLPRSKGDLNNNGRSFRCPALSRLCPVEAYQQWLAISGLTKGPIFRSINRWGNIGTNAIAAGSIVPWLRHLFGQAGVEAPESYSSHSLRRGFATWAQASGWDVKELMEYVGWRDVKSAIRYIDVSGIDLSTRFECGLTEGKAAPSEPADYPNPQLGQMKNGQTNLKKNPPRLRVVK